MGSSRLVVAVALVALVALGLGWLWLHPAATDGVGGSYALLITGPNGGMLYNGTVADGNGTVLSLLRSAAVAHGFTIDVTGFQGYANHCEAAYVRGIGGYEASGASGWVYAVRSSPASAWQYPAQSSACFGLQPGDDVWWRWTDTAVPEGGT